MKTLKNLVKTAMLNVEELMMIKGAAERLAAGCWQLACKSGACTSSACTSTACTGTACSSGSCNGATCESGACNSRMDEGGIK